MKALLILLIFGIIAVIVLSILAQKFVNLFTSDYVEFQDEPEEEDNLSECCGAEIIHHDICSKCKERV